MKVDREILEKLRERAGRMAYGPGAPGRHLFLFAREGFSPDVVAQAEEDPGLHLIGLADLLRPPPPAPRAKPAPGVGDEPETKI